MKRVGAERGEKTDAEFELHLSGGPQVGKKGQHPEGRAAGRRIHGEMTIFLLFGQSIGGSCSACEWGLEGFFLILFCLL